MGNPAIETVKALESETGPGEVVLSTGVRVKLRPVPAWLVQETQSRIRDPEVPVWRNPDKDRDEPNPNDPAYLGAITQANVKRAESVTDVILLMGVELVDGIPEDDTWLPRLRYLEKRGYIDFGDYDLTDPLDRELVFKKYVAMGSNDFFKLGSLAGLSGEDVQQAAVNFRRDAKRRADRDGVAKE